MFLIFYNVNGFYHVDELIFFFSNLFPNWAVKIISL